MTLIEKIETQKEPLNIYELLYLDSYCREVIKKMEKK